jgi:hypothetical protein
MQREEAGKAIASPQKTDQYVGMETKGKGRGQEQRGGRRDQGRGRARDAPKLSPIARCRQ